MQRPKGIDKTVWEILSIIVETRVEQMSVEYRLLEVGKHCLELLEYVIHDFRTVNPADGFVRMTALSKRLMEWYRILEQVSLNNEDQGTELAWVMSNVLDAVEKKDEILIADMLELQLRPQIYRLQARLLDMGIPFYSFDIFKHNVELVQAHMPELAVLMHLDTGDIYQVWEDARKKYIASGRLEPSSSGWGTYFVNSRQRRIYAHSNANPVWEAYIQACQYYDEERESYFLFGMGLGYLPQKLLELDDSINVVIYEFSEDCFYMALLANPLDWLFEWEKCRLVYDPSLESLSEFLSEETVNIYLPSAIYAVQPKKVQERLELMFLRDVNIRKLKKVWPGNFRSNIRCCNHYVDELKLQFDGRYAVIVAAGPSLDKNIHLLGKLPPDTLIVAVGTVFKRLLEIGTEPDYVVFSDSDRDIFIQIDTLVEEKVPIIIESTASYRIAAAYQGPKYLVCQQDYKKSSEYAARNGYDTYASGGSVATLALSLCAQLGCSEIAFVGLDLAYTDERTHAEGTGQGEVIELKELKPVRGAYEDVVYISKAFELYCEWIERYAGDLIKTHKCRRVIDATEGGVLKKNLERMTLQDVIDVWT